MGVKKSNFTALDNIPDDATLDFVSNGGNFKITKADFITQMGATGTLSQLGDPLGTPILNISGTDNQIRNLEPGSGINVSVSPNLGALIKHNFQVGTAGQVVLNDITALSPVIRNLVGISGISVGVSTDGKNLEIGGATVGLANQVAVTQAAQLSGTLDSTKEYFIDGIVDMGSQSIEIPAGGLTLSGYNFDVSKLISSSAAYTLFTSPVGGSGNLIFKDLAIEITGAGSKVYDVTSDTGNEAIEIARVNYNNCSSLGSMTNYRQGLETGTGRFGGKPELELIGVWSGGFFIDVSIVRSLTDGAYTLFKAGAGFAMASRFRSNANIDLPASASFLDFSASNFANPSTLQLVDCIVTRAGVQDASDSNLTPNIAASTLASAWSGNNGLPNTFVGGKSVVTSEALTAITQNVFTDLLGTYTAEDLQHFDAPANGQLRHLGQSPVEYKVGGQMVIEGDDGDVIALKIVIFRDATTSFEDGDTVTRVINNLQGARNVAYFALSDNITLSQDDYVKIQITNTTDGSDATAELDSFFTVEAR